MIQEAAAYLWIFKKKNPTPAVQASGSFVTLSASESPQVFLMLFHTTLRCFTDIKLFNCLR